MKKQIGSFFREYVDRRKEDRGTSPIADYEGYFLGKKTHPDSPAPACPFCGSDRVAFRRKDKAGRMYWYCTSCRQEIRT
jgi:ssDNA-binding Zn-finger/Zn-ribbon topoisomerase 1